MKTPTTDLDALPRRWRPLLPLTGLSGRQVRIVYLLAQRAQPQKQPGRPWGLPLAVRVLLVPILAAVLRPNPTTGGAPWIIDGTLIPVHDQTLTAPSKNYRRSINTQIIICAPTRAVVAVGDAWPGNRNDVVVARATVAHLLTGRREVLGDGGYRGIATITTPRRDRTGRIIWDEHYRAHRRIRARVEHVIARLKNWQILRQCRRRGQAINHSLHIITGLWNTKNKALQTVERRPHTPPTR